MNKLQSIIVLAAALSLGLLACRGDAPNALAESDAAGGEYAPMDGDASGEQRIREYRLSMDVLRRFPAIYENLAVALQDDPGIVDRMEAEGEESFDESLARMRDEPALRRAIEGAGVSIEDYMLTSVALAGAEMYNYFPDAYDDATRPPEHQIQFVQDNRAEIDEISARLRSIEGEIDD